MMRRLSTRAWVVLMIALGLVATASGAGLVLSLHAGSRAQPAAAAASPGPQPGSAQARADLATMQSLLNSGSVSKQAALLAPVVRFAPGSGPVVPPGKTITILPGTLRSGGQFGTVQARVSDGTTVTLGLYQVQGRWRLYAVKTGSAQTSARVTGQPAIARLLSGVTNPVPGKDEIGIKQPVILVHGWNGDPSAFGSADDPASMRGGIRSIPGVWVGAFNYKPTSSEWVDKPGNGPDLMRYINRVAHASKLGHGPGKVIVVGYSMGGLMTRWAAYNGAAGNIAMVVTVGTPNTGSLEANAMAIVHRVTCDNTSPAELSTEPGLAAYCAGQSAYAGMSMFGSQIRSLPELDTHIPLHAIAGREVLGGPVKIWNAQVNLLSAFGDFVVPERSALHQRPGGTQTVRTVTNNPDRLFDFSAAHPNLPKNPEIIQLVRGYVSDYLLAHPAPAPVQTTPALGGDAYWLAEGGQWQVHGAQLRISRGPSGLTGDESWNVYGQIVTAHAELSFTSNADGSLTGTYISPSLATCVRTQRDYGATCYTYRQGTPSDYPNVGSASDPSNPQLGQTITLVPVAPYHAKAVYNGNSPSGWVDGNPNWCQAGLETTEPGFQYCGA